MKFNGKIKDYRADIDGMRAIAVLSVITFHLDSSYLPGGFLGVDIFFVISGFLITRIVHCEISNKQFSFLNFYTRRAKRILPAFFFMLSLTLLAGYFILLPHDYYKLSISSISTLGFASNIQFSLRHLDYFASGASEWPLLHTWSLAVEEQYYFLLPFILIFLNRYFRAKSLVILSVICLASFFLAELFSNTTGMDLISYYGLPTRIGELLIGSLLAIYLQGHDSKKLKSNLLPILALVTIAISFVLINKTQHFPGLLAVPVCVATAIIICSSNSPVNKILSNKILVHIGLMSYSLYLMHWPILAFLRYIFNVEDHILDNDIQLISVALIIFLSLFSHYFIEKPARRSKFNNTQTAIYFFLLPSLLIGVFSVSIFLTRGDGARLSSASFEANKAFNHMDKSSCPSRINLGCVGGDELSENVVILYGNSHAQHYSTYINKLAKNFNFRVELVASAGCTADKISYKCSKITKFFLQNYQNANSIILAYRWDTLLRDTRKTERFESLIESIKSNSRKITLIAQPPIWNVNVGKMFNCKRLNMNCKTVVTMDETYPSYNDRIKSLAEKHQVNYFDPYSVVNNKHQISDEFGRPYYADTNHLSIYGNEKLYNDYLKKNSFAFF